jgi:AraC-like DNA-binding protein
MSNKPVVEKLVEDPGQSFLFRKIVRKKRPDYRSKGVWHYHPEYEITLSLKSSGKRFVGYSIDNYSHNELVLLGENLPHCWITNQSTEQYVINFKKDSLGTAFWNSPEFIRINKLLNKSKQGIKFSETTIEKATPLIIQMKELDGFNRLLVLFKLLNLLSLSKNIQLLTFNNYRIKDSLKASNRIEKIYSYIYRNYNSENISISNLSKELFMTTSSVCKFIKTITKKTFTELLIETRINEACKLLSETDKYISEICYLSGFNNLSSFNRAFKRVMHVTPKEYRKIY